MLDKPTSRLIWQNNSPAPFESAWSIFSKLLALNGKKPFWIAKLLAKKNFSLQPDNYLNFRDSSWIDFDRFETYLDVAQSRLRFAFLDQIGFQLAHTSHSKPGIKICTDCLVKGYHCILFELGFIDICPWHKKKLEPPCNGCYYAVSHRGLKPLNKKNSQFQLSHEDAGVSEWGEFKSSCEHIYFKDGHVGKLNKLSITEEDAIVNECIEFMEWWRKVSQNEGIANYLTNESFSIGKRDPLHLDKFISAAENIAGSCPWPLGHIRKPIRSQIWAQLGSEINYDKHTASRKSEWGSIYSSIRRYIFRRYVRQHRICWNELSSYGRHELIHLNSDTVCPVALAFASWRLAIESFKTVAALKTSKIKEKPIRVMGLPTIKDFAKTSVSFASLLFGLFFQIWEDILQLAGKKSFAISIDQIDPYRPPVAISVIVDSYKNGVLSCQWTLIFPDPNLLERQSFIACCGKLKKSAWMSYQTPFIWFYVTDTYTSRFIFKIRKRPKIIANQRVTYYYLNIDI
ncbi:MAG: hypothetical protein OEV35_00110 [Gallionellaceae bacterium]|nr:hypothetical protein [Gallionellaceae bacterium]